MPNFTTKKSGDIIEASHINDLQDAIMELEKKIKSLEKQKLYHPDTNTCDEFTLLDLLQINIEISLIIDGTFYELRKEDNT